MTESSGKQPNNKALTSNKGAKSEARMARSAEALRANLRRRKDQKRAQEAVPQEQPSPGEAPGERIGDKS